MNTDIVKDFTEECNNGRKHQNWKEKKPLYGVMDKDLKKFINQYQKEIHHCYEINNKASRSPFVSILPHMKM